MTIEEIENPFLEESEDLLVLESKDIAGPAAVTRLRQIKATEKKQSDIFIAERFEQIEQSHNIMQLIETNSACFTHLPRRRHPRQSNSFHLCRAVVHSFQGFIFPAKLEMETWMNSSENQGCHLSLSHLENLRLPGKKSELKESLQSLTHPQIKIPAVVDVIIIVP
jgi:hypothetical protein